MAKVIILLCKSCNEEWGTIGYEELGGITFKNEEKAYCPYCGIEGEIIGTELLE